jgi:hypothetical protein
MAVVIFTDSTLMPDTNISIIKKGKDENDEETVKKILNDLRKAMKEGKKGVDKKKTFINSVIIEVKVEDPPKDFKLNLYFKPTIDIVS